MSDQNKLLYMCLALVWRCSKSIIWLLSWLLFQSIKETAVLRDMKSWWWWTGIVIHFVWYTAGGEDIDENGYVVYCPCMGRFGNQADHFLGSFSFAQKINRTLILPPWVEYHRTSPKSVQVPFDHYFSLEPLRRYHRVITMDHFMNTLADTIWPPGKHIVFCYGPREGAKENDCNAKEGNPFGPFWDTFNIDFDGSQYYGRDLSYDTRVAGLKEMWNSRFPPAKYPVLAFAGAPAAFPVNEHDRGLHAYLEWSPHISDQADEYIKNSLPDGPFVGVHLRNDLDWDNVCHYADPNMHLFASPQCLGYHFEYGRLSSEICQPSVDTIKKDIVAVVKAVKAKAVFIASDRDHMMEEINEALGHLNVSAYKRSPDEPRVSLAILARSSHFIGNCVSSFSAFVKRERERIGRLLSLVSAL